METGKRHIKSGTEFSQYFDRAEGTHVLIKRGSTLTDTIKFLPNAILATKQQTAQFALTLRGLTKYQTCQNLWNWVYQHINYEKDDKGKEQIRSPQRSFWDRKRGVDCDDYTVFISSVLTNLKIPHILRVAKYSEANGFQHIYPVVPIGNGKYITVDCVVDRFNYEVPFIEKIDKRMDLEFLNGLGDIEYPETGTGSIDAQDLLNGYDEDMGDLGRRRFRDTKFAQVVKKGLHLVNRVNPGAALLRTGILAALKVNMFKIAERLRFAYLDPSEAQRRNFDMGKFQRLVGIKERLEKIFYGAGGKMENFKKAILTGRGNRSKEVPVSGLGYVDYNDYSENHSLSQILGMESYASEMNGVEGLGSLGEPATGAAIAAATSVLAAIAGLLKSIGSLRKGGKEGDDTSASSSDGSAPDSMPSIQETSLPNDLPTPDIKLPNNTSPNGSNSAVSNSGGANDDTPASDENSSSNGANQRTASDDSNLPATNNTNDNTNKTANVGFMDKAKTWVKENPVKAGALVVAAISLGIWGYSALTKKKAPSKTSAALSGIYKKRKHSKKKKSSSQKHHSKKTIKFHKLK